MITGEFNIDNYKLLQIISDNTDNHSYICEYD